MPANIFEVGERELELNARPDRLDLRDRPYNPPLTPLKPEFPTAEEIAMFLPLYEDLILDQGKDGACTGYGLAAVINYQFWFRDVVEPAVRAARDGASADEIARAEPLGTKAQERLVSPRMLYQMARLYDEWDGEDYSGSSCRGAMRGWYHHGVCLERTWPYKNPGHLFEDSLGEVARNAWLHEAAGRPLGAYYRIAANSIPDMQAAIQQVHAIFVSAEVHAGWADRALTVRTKLDNADLVPPQIEWTRDLAKIGVHAFAVVGYNRDGFIVQNSWGKGWGNRGFAILTYADWLANGIDAWASVYGARTEMICPPKTKSTGSLQTSAVRSKTDGAYSSAVSTAPWDTNFATLHTVILGNNGRAMSRLVHAEDGKEHLLICAEKRVLRWCEEHEDNNDLVIFAHGGLTNEAATLRRSAILGPWFKANRIYPLFLSWTTGVLDDLEILFRNAIGIQKQKVSGGYLSPSELDRQIKATNDYTWEAIASGVSIRSVWTELKANAALAASSGGGLKLLARHLRHLRTLFPEMNIHLVGHSAGAFALGGLLDELRRLNLPVQSTTLWAPACSMHYASEKFGAALRQGIVKQENFAIELLDEEIERRDGVVGLYSKSFLYLVSRALERAHRTPLLGLQSSWRLSGSRDPGFEDAKAWKQLWGAQTEPFSVSNPFAVIKLDELGTNPQQIKMTHGCFDQSVWQLQSAIERMLARPPRFSVTNLTGV